MQTSRVWVFRCKNWLCMHRGDYRTRRDLEAQEKERVVKGSAAVSIVLLMTPPVSPTALSMTPPLVPLVF